MTGPRKLLARALRSWRVLATLAGAVVVTFGMLAIADGARRASDRAREAQVLMERMRGAGIRVNAVTWRGLATARNGQPPRTSVSEGMAAYTELTTALQRLDRLGESGRSVVEVERRVGDVWAAGMGMLVQAQRNPSESRYMALNVFAPAVVRLDAALTAASRRQSRIAHSELQRGKDASLASMLGGLLLLGLLAWQMHRLQRRNALAELARAAERQQDQRLRALLRHSSDVVAVMDAAGRLTWVAESVERVLGHPAPSLTGRHLAELVHPEDAHRALPFLEHALASPGTIHRESLRLRSADGAHRHLELLADNRLEDPLVEGVLLNVRDVTRRLELEDQLRHQAFHDTLTGLANRALFENRLTRALAHERRHHDGMAVLFIDLDDFKTVNDSLGHGVGDELLRVAAARIAETLRPEDTAARLGGDEFGILVEGVGDEEVLQIAERIRVALEPPVEAGGRTLTMAASIGVARPEPGSTADDVLRNADVAMYAAKERGKGRVAVFEPTMHARVVERLELTGDLDSALANGELRLVYQPLVQLDGGAITAVEALLRWDHPRRGLLAPDRFIGIAESSGLIVPIGRWVLQTACEQLRRWQLEQPGASDLCVSVNVSTRQLADPNFPADVRAIIAGTGVTADRVTLEITERMLADDSQLMRDQVSALKAAGVRIAIDDFGTGYSALSYLRAFPVDSLKIDRSFIADLGADEEKARLVRGIIDMARALDLDTVTEGIERSDQATVLRELHSEVGQGFLFSPPVDPTTIDRMLADGVVHDRPAGTELTT